jgi:hypothetical protein
MSSIYRKSHCLKREKTLTIPRNLLFFDTETTQTILPNGSIKQTLKLGWVCYWRRSYGRNLTKTEWFYFEKPEQFWEFVYTHTERKQKLWIMARNIVFDFTVVSGWKHLRLADFKLKFFHNTGTTTIITVKSKQGSIVFLDTMNWFVESLQKTGERLGIPKLKIDFKTCTKEYLSIYCKRDVEIEIENFKRFISFLQDNTISRLCYTKGSTAMSAYLFSHYYKRIYIHNNKEAIDLERSSYKGGRTECFYLGDLENGDYYIVDVNSLYPYVMREHDYPVKYKKIYSRLSISTLIELLSNNSVVAECLINTNEPVYAVRSGRTIFPIGKFWTVLTTPELLYAIEHEHIVEVKKAVVYEQSSIFTGYVDRFYALRQKFKAQDNSEYEDLCKKMLNSLYGKFGQKADVWTKIGVCPNEPDRVELCFRAGINGMRQIRYLLGEIFELEGYQEAYNSFPAIPAHVAAYGRLHLYELMKQAGHKNYYYCDTDSLIVNAKGLSNLENQLDNVKLGSLKLVETIESMTIRGLKDYSTQTKTVIKGIRRNAVEISKGVYQQESWPSFKGLLRKKSPNTYIVDTITKTLSRTYTKGLVQADGSILPFVFHEPDL